VIPLIRDNFVPNIADETASINFFIGFALVSPGILE